MNEITQLKKLMEAVQLNEYIVQNGDSVNGLLALNIFTDAESRPSEFEEEFRNSPEWMNVEIKFYQIAANLENAIRKSSAKLDDIDVDEVHRVWYDGSDAYSDVETAIVELPKIYVEQLSVIREILMGQDQSIENGTLEGKTVTEDQSQYDMEFDDDEIIIYTYGGEPVLTMSMESWERLMRVYNNYNRDQQGPE